MLALTKIKDGIRALRPVTPFHREGELDAHVDVIDAQIDRVLDDKDMPVRFARQQLDNCHLFARSLVSIQEDD